MSIPSEVLKKIKLLEVAAQKMVNSLFAGQYHSAFKGQGMTFSDFRQYVPGDDVRAISWNLTARTGETYIKKFEEERDLTIILAVDISGSVNFGSKDSYKGEVLTHLSALLGFSANKNNDNVGLLLFTDQVEHFVPPKKGRGHIQRILRDLYYHKPKSQGTRITPAVDFLFGILKKRSNVFIFSDFMDDEPFGGPLKKLGRKHDTVGVRIVDPVEMAFPSIGLIDFVDPETGDLHCLDSSSPIFRRQFQSILEDYRNRISEELKKARVDLVALENGEDFIQPLAQYFQRRKRR